jgi:hypothetical protein
MAAINVTAITACVHGAMGLPTTQAKKKPIHQFQ